MSEWHELIGYDRFEQILNGYIYTGKQEYIGLFKSLTSTSGRKRFTGLFRSSSAKVKVIQHLTQSREIKFGGFLEQIIEEYLEKVGYHKENNRLLWDEEVLQADYVLTRDKDIFMIEQKVRDDHDSTKRVGQFENFHKKALSVKRTYENYQPSALMYFVDPGLRKNEKYYENRILQMNYQSNGITAKILYGNELFVELGENHIWEELCSHLKRWRMSSRTSVGSYDVDFHESETVLDALQSLNAKQLKELLSNDIEATLLRKELFDSDTNFNRLLKYYRQTGRNKEYEIMRSFLETKNDKA